MFIPEKVSPIIPNTVLVALYKLSSLAVIAFWVKRISSVKPLSIEENQAYRSAPLAISRRVSKALMDAGLCTCSEEVLKGLGAQHKWVHVRSVCDLVECEHKGEDENSDCTKKVQTHQQRNRPYERIREENLHLPIG